MKRLLRVKSAVSILLACCLLSVLLCACGGGKTEKYTLSSEIITSGKELSFSSCTTGATRSGKIASSGLLTLFIDRKTASPVIRNGKTFWRALPKSVSRSSEEIPAVLSVEVINAGQRYVLNSQTDCVKNSLPVSRKTDSGVCTEYAMVLSADGKSVTVTVPVTFSLVDGSFFVSVKCADITTSDEDFVVTKLRLMDYFGSDTGANEGDYILVPDNCGAIIDTYNVKSGFEKLSFKVYGDAEKNNTLLGAYGMKKKNSAFVAMIEKGDSIATVSADTVSDSGYNRVGAEFEITEALIKSDDESETVYVSGNSYKDEIRLCYRFLEDKNADYSGMAIACREHLIRTGVLSADTVDSTSDLPFLLTTSGEAVSAAGKTTSLTTCEQLLDMLTYLKGKGFSNIFVKYKGTLTGGLSQSAIQKCEMLKTLGTQEDFEELNDYVSAQQMKLFFDLGFTSYTSVSAKTSDFARDLSGALCTVEKTNLFDVTSKYGVASYDEIDDNVISLFPLTEKSVIKNISVNDASAFLYSDSENGATRDDVQSMIKTESASLTTIGELMVEKGNFYMLKNASVISSMPLKASVGETDFYKSVPFIPLILHATTEYSTEPINLGDDYHRAMLRAVEYGALPQFEWCYEEIESGEEPPQDAEETSSQEETEQTPHPKTKAERTPTKHLRRRRK